MLHTEKEAGLRVRPGFQQSCNAHAGSRAIRMKSGLVRARLWLSQVIGFWDVGFKLPIAGVGLSSPPMGVRNSGLVSEWRLPTLHCPVTTLSCLIILLVFIYEKDW